MNLDDTRDETLSVEAVRRKWRWRRFKSAAYTLLTSRRGPLYRFGLVALVAVSAQAIYAHWHTPPAPWTAPLTLPGDPRPATALHIPMPILEKTLTLTDAEKSKIKTIHDSFHSAERSLRPEPRSREESDPAVRQAAQAKIADAEKQSESQMEAILTPAQREQLPALLTEVQNLEQVGITAPVYADLGLTADQKQRLAVVAETARSEMQKALVNAGQSGGYPALRDNLERIQYETHQNAQAILTASQQATVAAHHPRPPHKPHPPRGPRGPERSEP